MSNFIYYNVTKNLKITLTYIGTLIGAGFVSGREIVLYFGNTHFLSPLLAALFCGIFAFIFLEMSRLSQDNIPYFIFKDKGKILDIILKFSNIIIIIAMLAGAEFIIEKTINLKFGSLIVAFLAFIVATSGSNGLKNSNMVLVPLIIAMILFLFFKNINLNTKGELNFLSPILYASMNILSGGLIISKISAKNTQNDNIFIAFLSFLILSILISAIYFMVKNSNAEMPIFTIATYEGLKIIGGFIILIAIFTTLTSSIVLVGDYKTKRTLIIIIVCLLLSVLGFNFWVNTFYPFIGVLGALVTTLAIAKLISYNQTIKIFEKQP